MTYTLAISAGLPQDISALQISYFPDGITNSPETIGFVEASNFTPAQVPLYTGPKTDRFVWNIDCTLPGEDMLKLLSLYEWQQNRLRNRLDGRLSWTDGFMYLPPQVTLTRSVTQVLTTADGQSYGYPVVDCLISAIERTIVGPDPSYSFQWTRCIFQVTEVR